MKRSTCIRLWRAIVFGYIAGWAAGVMLLTWSTTAVLIERSIVQRSLPGGVVLALAWWGALSLVASPVNWGLRMLLAWMWRSLGRATE